MGKHNPKRTVSMVTELQQVSAMCARLHELLATVTEYIDNILVSYSGFRLASSALENWVLFLFSRLVIFLLTTWWDVTSWIWSMLCPRLSLKSLKRC